MIYLQANFVAIISTFLSTQNSYVSWKLFFEPVLQKDVFANFKTALH